MKNMKRKWLDRSILQLLSLQKKKKKYNPIEAQVELTMATLSDYMLL